MAASSAPAAAAPPHDVYMGRMFIDVGVFLATSAGASGMNAGGAMLSNEGAWLFRTTIGFQLSRIAAGGLPSFHLRVGASAYVSSLQLSWTDESGIGGDAELDMPVSCVARLGGHVGVATEGGLGKLLTAGPRLFLFDDLWFGVELFHFSHADAPAGPLKTGVLAGGGFAF